MFILQSDDNGREPRPVRGKRINISLRHGEFSCKKGIRMWYYYMAVNTKKFQINKSQQDASNKENKDGNKKFIFPSVTTNLALRPVPVQDQLRTNKSFTHFIGRPCGDT